MRVGIRVFSLVAMAGLMVALMACGSSNAASSSTTNEQVGGVVDSNADAQAINAATIASGFIPSNEAGQHLGEEVTVRGKVVDYQVHRGKPGRPFLLLFDIAGAVERGSSISDMETPSTFTMVIWGKDKKSFVPNFQAIWNGKVLCVTGTIEDYRGSPAIIATQADQVVADC